MTGPPPNSPIAYLDVFAMSPTHVSETPTKENISQESVRSPELCSMTPDMMANAMKAILDERDRLKRECVTLRNELFLRESEVEDLRKETSEMKFRLQQHYDSLDHAAKFAAYIASVKPDFADSTVTCHGCAKTEFETELKKYGCANRNCQPLTLCQECFKSHPSCVKCMLPMRDEPGWRKRRLPPSWVTRAAV